MGHIIIGIIVCVSMSHCQDKFETAYINLRSQSRDDVRYGLESMQSMMANDPLNEREYIYNIAYGYYRLNDPEAFNRIFAVDSFNDPQPRLLKLRKFMTICETECKRYDTLPYMMLPIASGMLMLPIILMISQFCSSY